MPQTLSAAEVNYIVDHLLVTDDPRSTATAQVEALLRHHPPEKTREILYDTSQINGLKLTDRRGSDIPIEPSVRTRLLALAPFIHHCQNLAGPSAMVSIHIPSLTRTSFERYIDQFDEANPTQYDASEARENYRTWMAIGRDSIPFQDPALYAQGSNNTTANNNNNTAAATAVAAAPSTAPPIRPTITVAEKKKMEFRKGKRSTDVYAKLANISDFYTYWKDLKTHAYADDCDEVLNPLYIPGPDDVEVFPLKTKHMFTVFHDTIQETEGKNIVDQYRGTYDAQGLATALYDFYTNSPLAGIRRDDLLVIITTSTLPIPLSDTRFALFSEYKAMITRYNDIAPPGLELSDVHQVQYMIAFIRNDKGMHAVAQQLSSYRVVHNTPITPRKTVALIEAAAAGADKIDKSAILRVRSRAKSSHKRFANFVDLADDEAYVNRKWEAYHTYQELDTPQIFVNKVEMEVAREVMNVEYAQQEQERSDFEIYRSIREGTIRIDGNAWSSLSAEGKNLFRKFSHDDKNIIAQFFRGTSGSANDGGVGATPSTQRGRPGSASRNRRRANVVETDDPSVGSTPPENATRSVQQHNISTSFVDPFDDDPPPPPVETYDLFNTVRAPPSVGEDDEVSLPEPTNICRLLSAHEVILDEATDGLDLGGAHARRDSDISLVVDETIDIEYESAAEETKIEYEFSDDDETTEVAVDMPPLMDAERDSSSDDDLSDGGDGFLPVVRRHQPPIPELTDEERKKARLREKNRRRRERRKVARRMAIEASSAIQAPPPNDSPFSTNSFQVMMSEDTDSDSCPSPRRTRHANVVLRSGSTTNGRHTYIDRGCNPSILDDSDIYMAQLIRFSPVADRVGDVGYELDEMWCTIIGQTYRDRLRRRINAFMASRVVRVSAHKQRKARALIDRGANGSIAGGDMRFIAAAYPPRQIDLTGIDDHRVANLKVGSYGGVCETNRGKVILIVHDAAGMNRGKSIICPLQMEHNGVTVDDRPISLGGTQSLTTLEGYKVPLDVFHGLCYMRLRPFTDKEFEELPHVELTRDMEWDPTAFDSDITSDKTWYDGQVDTPPLVDGFTHDGHYLHRTVDIAVTSPESVTLTTDIDDRPVISIRDESPAPPPNVHAAEFDEVREFSTRLLHLNEVTPSHFSKVTRVPLDAEDLRRYWLHQPKDVVEKSLDASTQHYRNLGLDNSRIIQPQKSPYPANNVTRRNETLSTDLLIPNIGGWGGIKLAQIFVGVDSKHVAVYGLGKESEFPGALEDVIREYGAPDILGSDCARSEQSNRVKDLLRRYCIDAWYSEPGCQWQNFAERIIQEMKKFTEQVLNVSGAPPESWFLAVEYVVFIWNRTARKSLKWRTPHEALYGQTPDTSILMSLTFWEQVLIKNYKTDSVFPSEPNEIPVRMVGFAENVGHSITFKLWNEETQRLIFRSRVKRISGSNYNKRALPDGITDDDHARPPPEPPPPKADLRLQCEQPGNEAEYRPPSVEPLDWVGRTYLKPCEKNGERHRAKILECIEEFEGDLKNNPERVKFRTKVGDDLFEEVVEYSSVMNFIEEQEEWDVGIWKFRDIIGHKVEKRVKKVLIEWESGERSWEPANDVFALCKYELAKYCKENDLIDKWTTSRMNLRKAAKREKNLLRAIKQAKLRSYRTAPVYQFGYQVPRNHQQAVEIDKENGNTKWQDSEKLEIHQMQAEYSSFRDMGHKSNAKIPNGYKRITLHFVYAVKHDGRHKSRLVAGGHLTDTPVESVYAGVVSLRGVRLVIFLAELNGLEIWQTDIGNAYLEARTKEKVYFIAGPEFASFGLEGHALMLVAAVYGLKSSGKRWHDCLADVMRDMGFSPCQAEPDIWMRECRPDGSIASESDTSREGHYYEYVAVYTDDLTIASKNPKRITDAFENVYKFKLKGTGPLSFLLGCDYFRDSTGTLCQQPKKYIAKMEETFERLFGKKPKHYTSPLEKGDHPECDTSELLGVEETKIYQSMIGAAQWLTQLGRFDIAVHVMTLSSFRASPRRGHLDRIRRIYGYVSKMKGGIIRYRTEMPDVSDLNYAEQDWSQTPYAGSKEEVPKNVPRALGKPVRLITFGDANLMHDLLTGKAVTGLLHFINKTPFDWYSKKQNTVETATYGAESIAGRTAIEQLRANKLTLHYLGVPIEGESILIGDNKTAVDAAVLPESRLHRRHLMLSFHYLKAALATGAFKYVWMDGKDNVSDVLTKHWGYQQVWPLLRPILFWEGDTMDILRGPRKVMKSITKRLRGK